MYLFRLIDDPLYRFALWILLAQIFFIILVTLVILILKVVRPKVEQKAKQEQALAKHSLLHYLNNPTTQWDTVDILKGISYRALFHAIEHLYTRVSPSERVLLRTVIDPLGLETHALSLSQSWFWWRRLEGVMLLGTVGGLEGEAILVHKLKDKYSSVAFHAAWSLVKISPIHARSMIMNYLSEATGLSFAQTIRLLRELDVSDMSTEELLEFFQNSPNKLKPQLIEAIVYSHSSHATHLVHFASISEIKEVRIAAFKVATQSRFNFKESELSQGVKDPEWEVRAQAVKAVGENKVHNLIPLLARALADQSWWVRKNTAWALKQLGEAGSEALSHVAHFSDDSFARDTARLALSEILMQNHLEMNSRINTMPLAPLISPIIDAQTSILLDPSQSNHLNTQELSTINMESIGS